MESIAHMDQKNIERLKSIEGKRISKSILKAEKIEEKTPMFAKDQSELKEMNLKTINNKMYFDMIGK